MPEKKSAERGYHHGHLRDALIRAADELLAERGLEGFYATRNRAPRRGVAGSPPPTISAAAPACSRKWQHSVMASLRAA